MHASFNLDPKQESWSKYLSIGQSIHNNNKAIVECELDKFKNARDVIQAEDIIENWFPKIKADIFLSHSHKDENLIIGLAGWLQTTFGLKSFIDSEVWGYADNLLKVIDDNYCKNKFEKTYNYNLRNRSTSHVHMMLSTALTEMIDRCECVIFVNTKNSFTPVDYLNDEGRTESPWIYSEIAMTRMIRQRTPEAHRPTITMDSLSHALEHSTEPRQLRISYPAELFHLTQLSTHDLNQWEEIEKSKRSKYPLDLLYEMKRR